MRRATLLLSFVAFCVISDAVPTHAQFIRGTVIHATTEAPLSNVSVRLLADGGRVLAQAVTDRSGGFYMQAARIGEYTLHAERIGLEPISSVLNVEVSQRVDIVLRMSEAAVPIEALTVEARQSLNIGTLAGYYERMQRSELLGIGTVLTRDWIADRRAGSLEDILRGQPRIRVDSHPYGTGQVRLLGGPGGSCIPKIFMDGMLTNRAGPSYVNELARPDDLEGVEIYRGMAEMGDYFDDTGCGVILLWTRRTGDDAPPFSWRRLLSFGVVVGLIGVLIY